MTELFRNSSPGALTMEQAIEREKKRLAERRRRKRQADQLAAQGRGGDTEIAHVSLGEIVLPDALQTPAVLDAIRQAAMDANIPLERFRIGNAANSINPSTGAPEFFGPLFDPKYLTPAFNAAEDWGRKLLGQGIDMARGAQAVIAEPLETTGPAGTIPPSAGAPPIPRPDSDLGYNPNGPSLFNLVTTHPMEAAAALWHAGRAWEEAEERYKRPGAPPVHNGEGDAWKHVRWNQRMTDSIGPEAAKRFADWNERKYGNDNPIDERSMDLENNAIGRSLTDNSPLTIDELIRQKRLRTKPYPY